MHHFDKTGGIKKATIRSFSSLLSKTFSARIFFFLVSINPVSILTIQTDENEDNCTNRDGSTFQEISKGVFFGPQVIFEPKCFVRSVACFEVKAAEQKTWCLNWD